MIHLQKGLTSTIIVTLDELTELISPNYLCIFEHRTTKEIVKFVLLNNDDLSDYKSRFNEFSITTNLYFSNSTTGQWLYEIWEQTSTTNLDPLNALSMVENGIMMLSIFDEPVVFDEYQTTNNFITR